MLTKEIGYVMEILESKHIQVQKITHIIEDGIEISKSIHRHVIHPGKDLRTEDAFVRTVAEAVHTLEVVTIFEESERLKQLTNR